MVKVASVQAVLFDAVGTLIYPDPPVADVYHLAGWQHGSQLAREEVAERFRSALRQSFDGELRATAPGDAAADELAGGPSSTDAGKLSRPPTSEAHERERWRSIVSQVFDDVPDTAPLFRTLWTHFAQPEHWRLFDDVPLVMQSGHPPLRQCQRCFVSSEIGFSKPDPRYFAAIEHQLGLQADAILLVGDDWENDYLGAKAAGWQAVYLRRQRSQIHQPGISSLLELCAFPLITG